MDTTEIRTAAAKVAIAYLDALADRDSPNYLLAADVAILEAQEAWAAAGPDDTDPGWDGYGMVDEYTMEARLKATRAFILSALG
jgi:hypothetical protein